MLVPGASPNGMVDFYRWFRVKKLGSFQGLPISLANPHGMVGFGPDPKKELGFAH